MNCQKIQIRIKQKEIPASIFLLQAPDLDHRHQIRRRKPDNQNNNLHISIAAKICEYLSSKTEQLIQTILNYRFNKVHFSWWFYLLPPVIVHVPIPTNNTTNINRYIIQFRRNILNIVGWWSKIKKKKRITKINQMG